MAGLILAMVATALVAYAVPSLVDRRYAVVNSREGDRFSGSLTLLEPAFHGGAPPPEPSSRPLLARTSSPEGTETQMGEAKTSSRPAPAPGNRGTPHCAREYAALRAKRASRVSIEAAAAHRRLVTAISGTALTLLVGALAAFGVVAWGWALLPLAFLGGTVAASIIAGERAKSAAKAEDKRLAELREAMGITKGARKSDPTPRSSVPSAQPSGAEEDSVTKARPAAPSEQDKTAVKTSADLARSLRSQAGSALTGDVRSAETLRPASGGEWDYVPMPAAVHTARPQVRGRVVRTHTDINGVQKVRPEAAVPGRPIRKSHTPMSVEELETSGNPTFRFDLDAVLDERRAQ